MRTRWLGIALCLAACGTDVSSAGSKDSTSTRTGTNTSIGLPTATAAATSTATSLGSATEAIVPRCQFSVGNDACVGDLYGSPGVPVDLYIVFDQSGSMATKDDGTTLRIDAVRDAVRKSLLDSRSAGLGVGIGYFGSQPLDCACTSCKPADYETPAVAIAALPDNAQAVLASLNGAAPTGETPTGAALRGSCAYAGDWKAKHPGREVAILLVTDGEPQAPLTSAKGGCAPTLADAVAAAASCQSENKVRVYVLGVGPSLSNLNQIAAVGGTSSAYLVQDAGSAGVLDALNAIRKDVQIPCALTLPKGNLLLSTVNVVYADAACALTTFPKVNARSACPAQGGWYFDNPQSPTSIQLCPGSCSAVAAPGGQLQLSIGCDTVIIP